LSQQLLEDASDEEGDSSLRFDTIVVLMIALAVPTIGPWIGSHTTGDLEAQSQQVFGVPMQPSAP
jgi:hypothetical protein